MFATGGFEKATMLKYQGVKVLIAVGGYKDSDAADPKWSTMMSNPVSRGKFVQSVLEFLEEHNFDGLDMDYEYPGCPQVSGRESRQICSPGPRH